MSSEGKSWWSMFAAGTYSTSSAPRTEARKRQAHPAMIVERKDFIRDGWRACSKKQVQGERRLRFCGLSFRRRNANDRASPSRGVGRWQRVVDRRLDIGGIYPGPLSHFLSELRNL